jgi:arylformamidase
VYKIASVVDRSVWFCGHSAGAHLVAMLLFSGWLHQLDYGVRHLAKGFVLVSGVYDLTPLVSTYINDALQLSRQAVL